MHVDIPHSLENDMDASIKDKVAVVTGGSTGIGLAIARAWLAAGGGRVYITGRSQDTLAAAADALGRKAVALVSDVAQLSDLKALADEVEARGDRIDALFANAGIAETNAFGATREEDYLRTFDINVKGVFFTVQTLAPLLADGASVVLTSSICATMGMENLSLYSASKAAVRSFARTWATDLKSRKIRVNALSPGFTRTPIMENGLKWDQARIDAFHEHARAVVPLGYVAQPEEIAASALFLASGAARYVNGIELLADGGLTQV